MDDTTFYRASVEEQTDMWFHANMDRDILYPPAGSTDGRLHVVIATKAIELAIFFSALGSQCFPAEQTEIVDKGQHN